MLLGGKWTFIHVPCVRAMMSCRTSTPKLLVLYSTLQTLILRSHSGNSGNSDHFSALKTLSPDQGLLSKSVHTPLQKAPKNTRKTTKNNNLYLACNPQITWHLREPYHTQCGIYATTELQLSTTQPDHTTCGVTCDEPYHTQCGIYVPILSPYHTKCGVSAMNHTTPSAVSTCSNAVCMLANGNNLVVLKCTAPIKVLVYKGKKMNVSSETKAPETSVGYKQNEALL
jgi:hypothetical protein